MLNCTFYMCNLIKKESKKTTKKVLKNKPYDNPNDIFKQKASETLLKLYNKHIVVHHLKSSETSKALIMDAKGERTASELRSNGFQKHNIHCVERERYARRKLSTIIRGDFTEMVEVAREKGETYDMIYADYEGNSHITKDKIAYKLPKILNKTVGIIAITVAKRQRMKGATFSALKSSIGKMIHVGACNSGMNSKRHELIDTTNCGRRGGSMATFFYVLTAKNKTM